ncbi:hypothetical protein BGZ95_006571 [Linnemannia exigua]|uniref:Uncharacterized protein n=1 Tax=Linnemannia exigua TaxID=604196 RepID=A0AAD4D0V4_9FUNG|nr:hypothetical protein BGZ95_006571 [Linnemannia exigua]
MTSLPNSLGPMLPAFLEPIQDPAIGANGDIIAQRVGFMAIFDTGKTVVTLGSATTKQLRRLLSPLPVPNPDPPPNPLSFRLKSGSKTQ